MEMKKPRRESFKLSKIKLLKDGGLDCIFEVEETYGSEIFKEKLHSESSKDVHPDLRNKFKELTPIVARIFYLTFFSQLIEMPEFEATEAQQELAQNYENEIVDKLDVRGISLSGSDKNKGIVITSLFMTDMKIKSPLNSPRMKFAGTKYGFEEEMERISEDICNEAYAFLFENKRAQLSMFGEDDMDGGAIDGKAEAAGKESRDLENEPPI